MTAAPPPSPASGAIRAPGAPADPADASTGQDGTRLRRAISGRLLFLFILGDVLGRRRLRARGEDRRRSNAGDPPPRPRRYRYCPVLAIVEMERPGSLPSLVLMSVRM